MKRLILFAGSWLLATGSFAQNRELQLQKAYQQFEADSQLRHATSSLYVIDAKTGKVIFDMNSQVGLAPASTQKIITSATAFELLGKDYRYKTTFALKNNDTLCIIPSGDPTFGSWRWNTTVAEHIMGEFLKAVSTLSLKKFAFMEIDYSGWNSEDIPDGWIWEDIGNYYGAGAGKLNWRENQADIFLKSGNMPGDSVKIIDVQPYRYADTYRSFTISEAVSAKKGSGDNAYFYFSLTGESYNKVRGTIPVNEDRFKISVATKNPEMYFAAFLADTLLTEHKPITGGWNPKHSYRLAAKENNIPAFFTYYSPSLDSINYWFLKKSINLYGEALIKTLAYEAKGFGNTDSGVVIIKNFWKQKGLDEEELNIADGSGLSPQNRVTTHAQVEVLKYAKTRNWFPYFYDALPEYNGMKMKSGSIKDVKGFCGYQKASDGNEYIFSFLVNNFNGLSSTVVNKMYKVLDVLKQ